MDSATFDRQVRIPFLIIVYSAALSAAFLSFWLAGAVIRSGLCAFFGAACPY
jgi:hypothetical protein